MLDHLGVACGPGCEVHQHDLVGPVGHPGPLLGSGLHSSIEVYPSVPPAVQDELLLQRGDVLRDVHLVRDVAGGGAYARLDAGGGDPVLDVVLPQHEGGRDHDRPDLVEGDGQVPELEAVLHDHQHVIPFGDALGGQEVGRLVGKALDVAEGERPLGAGDAAPLQRPPAGLRQRDPVHDVVCEVEIGRDVEMGAGDYALVVPDLPEVVLVQTDQSEPSFFRTIARNVHPSGDVAIIPCPFPES